MKTIFLSTVLSLCLLFSFNLKGQYQLLAADPSNDGANPQLADGTHFAYYYDAQSDSIHFRVELNSLSPSMASGFGCNVMVNLFSTEPTFNFWGQDNQLPYHYLLTAWVTGSPPSNYTGTIGIADASGVNAQNYTNLYQNNVQIVIEPNLTRVSFVVKREDIMPARFQSPSTGILSASVAAAVGSNQSWNDDLFDPDSRIQIDMNGIGLEENTNSTFHLYPNPCSGQLYLDLDKDQLIQIIDAQGRVLQSLTYTHGQALDLSFLKAGLYQIRTATGQYQSFIRQ
ncbi:T9SS type A sorting domain-containing protein [Croceimicrobium hydrocarbonivorans]|uniref:T9SS type A sorting domain-containing protein n=1 Tax=Croceimicrobium hydrocarbonivorans TaxID=2761580 RepID=A0A7H0VIN9_9FLAO|nr:T9SS type A sorting domain-containing protein [Croceimicrobium hydrocarbonivorans]QNR25587.1 T9SS type A sorting domain-containing protein [Croceimicrobium hydrocarbonivorans]